MYLQAGAEEIRIISLAQYSVARNTFKFMFMLYAYAQGLFPFKENKALYIVCFSVEKKAMYVILQVTTKAAVSS